MPGNQAHQPSLLSQEEQEQLKPKDVKVENPWIYEQTHQEYLENIKVSTLLIHCLPTRDLCDCRVFESIK